MVKVGIIEETTFVTDFIVESIVDRKVKNGKTFYLIKWAGWKNEENTWEPLDNLCNVKEELRLFDEKNIRIGKKIKKIPIVVDYQSREAKKFVQAYKKERRLIVRNQNIMRIQKQQRQAETNQTQKVILKRRPIVSRKKLTRRVRKSKTQRPIVQNPMEAEKSIEVFLPEEIEITQPLEIEQSMEIQEPAVEVGQTPISQQKQIEQSQQVEVELPLEENQQQKGDQSEINQYFDFNTIRNIPFQDENEQNKSSIFIQCQEYKSFPSNQKKNKKAPQQINNPFDEIRAYIDQCEKMLKKGEVIRVNEALFRIQILDQNNDIQKNQLVGVKAGQQNTQIFMEFARKLFTDEK